MILSLRAKVDARHGKTAGRSVAMTHIVGEVIVTALIHEVFDMVADERNEPRYSPRIVRAEKDGGGPVGAGARFVAEPRAMGPRGEMTLTMVEYERPHRLRRAAPSASATCSPPPQDSQPHPSPSRSRSYGSAPFTCTGPVYSGPLPPPSQS